MKYTDLLTNYRKYIIFIFILIFADIFTKELAYYFLGTHNLSVISDTIYIKKLVKHFDFVEAILVNNELDESSDSDIYVGFIKSLTPVLFFLYFLLLRNWNPEHYLKYLFTLFVIPLAIIFEIIFSHFNLPINTTLFSVLETTFYIAFPIMLLFLMQNIYSKIAVSLLIAGNISNILSFFYPPYTVTDFIYFPSNDHYYDFADFYIKTWNFMFFTSPLAVLTIHIYKTQTAPHENKNSNFTDN